MARTNAERQDAPTVGEMLLRHGISRRGFIQYCTAVASALALPLGWGQPWPTSCATLRGPRSYTCRFRSARVSRIIDPFL